MNPMAQILRQADTLELTQEAGRQHRDAQSLLHDQARLDLDAGREVSRGAARRYDQDEAYDRYRVAREASVDALIKLAPIVKSLLTADQMRKLPTFVTPFLDTRYLASVRSGTAGAGLGMIDAWARRRDAVRRRHAAVAAAAAARRSSASAHRDLDRASLTHSKNSYAQTPTRSRSLAAPLGARRPPSA